MIDLLNFVVGVICAFVLGLASHSVYLHQKEKYDWHFPWDHDEEDEEAEQNPSLSPTLNGDKP